MTTRDHLIAHVQELYVFSRDYLPVLHAQGRMCRLDRLRELLVQQHDDLRDEMETLERVLDLLSARITMERSPVVPGLEQASRRFRYRMNPSREQLDLHLALETLAVSQLVIGKYQGEIELARAIGEQDIALLLQENVAREEKTQRAVRQLLPALLQEAGPAEMRRVA